MFGKFFKKAAGRAALFNMSSDVAKLNRAFPGDPIASFKLLMTFNENVAGALQSNVTVTECNAHLDTSLTHAHPALKTILGALIGAFAAQQKGNRMEAEKLFGRVEEVFKETTGVVFGKGVVDTKQIVALLLNELHALGQAMAARRMRNMAPQLFESDEQISSRMCRIFGLMARALGYGSTEQDVCTAIDAAEPHLPALFYRIGIEMKKLVALNTKRDVEAMKESARLIKSYFLEVDKHGVKLDGFDIVDAFTQHWD